MIYIRHLLLCMTSSGCSDLHDPPSDRRDIIVVTSTFTYVQTRNIKKTNATECG